MKWAKIGNFKELGYYGFLQEVTYENIDIKNPDEINKIYIFRNIQFSSGIVFQIYTPAKDHLSAILEQNNLLDSTEKGDFCSTVELKNLTQLIKLADSLNKFSQNISNASLIDEKFFFEMLKEIDVLSEEEISCEKNDIFWVFNAINHQMKDFIAYLFKEHELLQDEKDITKAFTTHSLNMFKNIKLHISLHHDEYKEHERALEEILKNNITKIISFKRVSTSVRDERKIHFEKIQNLLRLYKAHSKDNKIARELNELLITNGFDSRTLDDNEHINALELNINNTLLQLKRFSEGDQFTIYIPKRLDKADILNLCLEIHKYITQHRLKPGTISDVASSITPNINFRCDMFNNQYIYGIKLSSDTDPSLREKVKIMQEKDDLYIYLTNNFKQKGNIFSIWLQPESKGKDELPSHDTSPKPE